MTKLEKVIKGLECCKEGYCPACPYYDTQFEGCDMYDDATKLLEEQRTRVMDIDEVLNGEDVTVWLEWIGCNTRSLTPTATMGHGDFSASFWNGEVHPIGLYGKQWRCWTAKPTDEQREKTKWRNE